MLAVLSDIHFQDTATSGPGSFGDANVHPAAFEHLWRQLEVLADGVAASMPITVVLNGDVIELLRSERWFAEGTRPYNFTSPPDAAMLRTAASIGDAILRENERAIVALGSRKARFVVVYGNHDRLLREDALAPVRARFAKLLGGDVTFVDLFRDERHRALIHHGHELDWTCSEYQHARVFDGWDATNPAHRMLAPLGDWVALDIGTRLPHLAWEMLAARSELSPPLRDDLYARLVHLDDLRPQGEILSWLMRPGGLDDLSERAGELAAIARFLGDLMNELVTQAMPRIEPWLEAHGRPMFDRLALGAVSLLGSTRYTASTLPAVMERIHAYLAGQDKPWEWVPRLDEWADDNVRFFSSGHTHKPEVMPLRQGPSVDPSSRSDGRWYVNTGTWRRAIVRSPLDREEYSTVKQLAYAVFYDAEESYRATGRLGLAFDFWQGASQRF